MGVKPKLTYKSYMLTNSESPNKSLRQYIQRIILVSLDNSRNGTGQYRQRKASHRHTRHGLILRTVRKPSGIHGIRPFHVVMNAIDGQEYGIQRNGNVGGMLPFVADAILLLGRTAVMRNDDDFETESVSQECLGLLDRAGFASRNTSLGFTLGFAREQIDGADVVEALHPVDAVLVECLRRSIIGGRVVVDIDYNLIRHQFGVLLYEAGNELAGNGENDNLSVLQSIDEADEGRHIVKDGTGDELPSGTGNDEFELGFGVLDCLGVLMG